MKVRHNYSYTLVHAVHGLYKQVCVACLVIPSDNYVNQKIIKDAVPQCSCTPFRRYVELLSYQYAFNVT